jgi:hypothetical protein
MLKKFSIVIILLIITTGVFAQSIPSGTGRYEALGFNPFITDPALDLVRNPAWGNLYRNYVFGDIGRADLTDPNLYKLKNQYAGISFGLGPKVFAGLILNKNEGRLFDSSTFYVNRPWGMGALGMDMPIVPVKLFIGITPNKGKFTIAASFYYTQKSQDSTLPLTSTFSADTSSILNSKMNYTAEKKSSIIGFTVGSLANFKDGWLEGNVDLRLNKMKYSYSRDSSVILSLHRWGRPDSVITQYTRTGSLNVENDGSMELNGYLRGMIMINKANQIKLVPYVSIGLFSWKPKYTPVDSRNDTLPSPSYRDGTVYDYEYKYFNLNGGVGINMPVFENGLLGFGVSVGLNSYKITSTETQTNYAFGSDTSRKVVTTKIEYKKSNFILPKINLGLEWKFTDWMTARLGYSRAIINDKIDNTVTVTDTRSRVSTLSSNNYVITSNVTNNPSNVIDDQNYSDPVQTISLGLGFHFNRFSIDGLIGEKFFQKGVNLLSGQDDKEMFGVLSASYNFHVIK